MWLRQEVACESVTERQTFRRSHVPDVSGSKLFGGTAEVKKIKNYTDHITTIKVWYI